MNEDTKQIVQSLRKVAEWLEEGLIDECLLNVKIESNETSLCGLSMPKGYYTLTMQFRVR